MGGGWRVEVAMSNMTVGSLLVGAGESGQGSKDCEETTE